MRGERHLRAARDRALWTLFVARLRSALAAHGATLELDVAETPAVRGPILLDLTQWGTPGSGSATLRIGRDVELGRGVIFELFPGGDSLVEIGDHSRIGDHVRLQSRGGKLRLGTKITLRSHVILKTDGELILTHNNELSYGAIVHCAERVEFEPFAGCAERVTVVDSDHPADGTDAYHYTLPIVTAPIVIGFNTFMATGAVITRGTQIGRNCVVGAGAVLTGRKPYPAGSLIAGTPGRVIRELGPRSDA